MAEAATSSVAPPAVTEIQNSTESPSSSDPAFASTALCPPPLPLKRQLSRQVSDLAIANKIDDQQKETLKMLLRADGGAEKNTRAVGAAQKVVAKLEGGNKLSEIDWDGLEQILASFTIDEIAPDTSNKTEISNEDPIITRLLSAEFEPPTHAPDKPTMIGKKQHTKSRKVVCYVIRHGERMDESDSRGWFALAEKEGRNLNDACLTEVGHKQAADAGIKLNLDLARSKSTCKAVLASPLERTAATGARVAHAIDRPLKLFAPAAAPALIVRQWGLEVVEGWLQFSARHMSYTKALIRPHVLASTSCSMAKMSPEHIVDTTRTFKHALEVQMAACAEGECVVAVTHREGIRKLMGTHRHIPYCAVAKFTVTIPNIARSSLTKADVATATGKKPSSSFFNFSFLSKNSKSAKAKKSAPNRRRPKIKSEHKCAWKFTNFL